MTECTTQFVYGKPVTLGADNDEVALSVLQKLDELLVRRLRRDVHINLYNGELQGFAMSQIWLDEAGPFRRN